MDDRRSILLALEQNDMMITVWAELSLDVHRGWARYCDSSALGILHQLIWRVNFTLNFPSNHLAVF
jgi:hypothetical protein